LLSRWAHWARCSLAMLTIGPERPAPHPRAFSTVDVTGGSLILALKFFIRIYYLIENE
jgi:hypothetical protein